MGSEITGLTTPARKQILKDKKTLIHDLFKSTMGLVIDDPKSGSGTSNDGNIASNGFLINETAFREYCLDTAKLYILHYDWHFVPPTVHKILIHGADVSCSI